MSILEKQNEEANKGKSKGKRFPLCLDKVGGEMSSVVLNLGMLLHGAELHGSATLPSGAELLPCRWATSPLPAQEAF